MQQPLYQTEGVIEQFLQQLGSEASTITTLQTDFAAANGKFINAEIWSTLNDPRIEFLWLGNINDNATSIITLRGVKNTSSLRDAANLQPNILFVDQVERLSNNLNQQQQQATLLLIAAYVVVMLLLTIRYPITTALMIVGAPLLASLISLSLLGLFGANISLFHVFGLFLILGLGMDYGIFLNSPLKHQNACLIAIFLSAVTSCLSFGLLSFSSAPMIHAFGITVLLGSLLNLVLVPAAALIAQQQANHNNTATGSQ